MKKIYWCIVNNRICIGDFSLSEYQYYKNKWGDIYDTREQAENVLRKRVAI